MRKYSVIYALQLMGATAIIAQILLIREFIVNFAGNELTIGIFLANWLILEATGAFIAGRLFRNTRSSLQIFTLLQGLLAVFFPLILYLARLSKSFLNLAPGEGSDIFTIFYTSLILLTPIAIIGGAQFSLGPGLIREAKGSSAQSIGKTYFSESIGSIFGGLFATYICMQYLDSFQTTFIVASLNIISAGMLLAFYSNKHATSSSAGNRVLKIIHLTLFLILIFIVLTGGLDTLRQQSLEKQWSDYTIVTSKNSIYGNVTLLEREQQMDLLSNGIPLFSVPTPDVNRIEDLVVFPLIYHPGPKSVFLIGGGPGGVLDELGKFSLKKIDYTELDPTLIQVMKEYSADVSATLINQKPLSVHYTDGRKFLINTTNSYDIIIINVPDPSTLELNRFYTEEFFKACADHLESNGLIIFRIPGSASYMNPHLSRLHACLLNTVTKIFDQHIIIPYEDVLVLASNNPAAFKAGPESLALRLNERKIETRVFSEAYIKYKLDPSRLDWYQHELSQILPPASNSDLKPSAVFYDLLYWNSLYSQQLTDFYLQLQDTTCTGYAIVLITLFVIIYILNRLYISKRNLHLFSSILTSGFAGMGITVIFALTFQAFYGYIYFWVGMIITAFMSGLATGSMLAIRFTLGNKNLNHPFLISEISFTIFFTVLWLFFLNLKYFDQTESFLTFFQFFIILSALICGVLVGFQFPVAGKIHLSGNGGLIKTAGLLYTADLIGAWAGGIVVTLIFIPILGIVETCFLILILKFGSTILFGLTAKTANGINSGVQT